MDWVIREIAGLVVQLTARGMFETIEEATPLAELPQSSTFSSFHFTTLSTHCGLKSMIPTPSQAGLIFSGVKASLLAGIKILKYLILIFSCYNSIDKSLRVKISLCLYQHDPSA